MDEGKLSLTFAERDYAGPGTLRLAEIIMDRFSRTTLLGVQRRAASARRAYSANLRARRAA